MSKARNAVIIIILCIIGAFSFKKAPQLGLNMPAPEDIKDAVAGGPARRTNGPKLTLAGGSIIMPSDISSDDTTRSITRNGTKIMKPISNARFSSEIMKAGATT